MAQKQEKYKQNEENRVDEVGDTNVFPVSEMEEASKNAEVHAPGKIGEAEEDGEPEQGTVAGGQR